MATVTRCPPEEPYTPHPAGRLGAAEDQGIRLEDRAAAPTAPAARGGFLGLLVRRTVERAGTHGAASAVGSLVGGETLLRTYREHVLRLPAQARGESYNVGLIVIELLIMRESLGSPGGRSTG